MDQQHARPVTSLLTSGMDTEPHFLVHDPGCVEVSVAPAEPVVDRLYGRCVAGFGTVDLVLAGFEYHNVSLG